MHLKVLALIKKLRDIDTETENQRLIARIRGQKSGSQKDQV